MANKPVGMAVPAAMPGGAEGAKVVEGVPVPTYEWMGLSAAWGTRIRPGEHGLRLPHELRRAQCQIVPGDRL